MTAVAGFTPTDNHVLGFTPAQSNVSGFTPQGGDSPYDAPRLKSLWTQAGGRPEDADIMAHVALAESSGNPHAKNQYTEGGKNYGVHGLWQISDIHGPGNYEDPLENARKAVELHRASGMTPWEDSRTKGGGGGWGQYYHPSPTGEAQLQNRDFPAHPKVAGFTPAVPAHPSPASTPPAPATGKVAGFTPLALSGQITDRPHVIGDTIANRLAQHPQPLTEPDTQALDAIASNLTAGTPAGGIQGALFQDTGEGVLRNPLTAAKPDPNLPMGSRFFDALGMTLTGHAGDANRKYGMMEDPTATRLGYGGPQGVIQKGVRAVQEAAHHIPGYTLPSEAGANDKTAPEFIDSLARGTGEFGLTLGKNLGNEAPGAIAHVVGDVAKKVPGGAQAATRFVRGIGESPAQPAAATYAKAVTSPQGTTTARMVATSPEHAARLEDEGWTLDSSTPATPAKPGAGAKVADAMANVGNALHGVGEGLQSSVDRYHAPLQAVHPEDRAAAQAALRAHDKAPARGDERGGMLTDLWAKGLAPGADQRVVELYEALYKGQSAVNKATNEERAAAQALRAAVAEHPSLGTSPIREVLVSPGQASKENPAGLTPLARTVLADHPGVAPERAVEVAQAMEHAERVPPNVTADERRRAAKLAQAEAILWAEKSKHPELVKGIKREQEMGYFPMRNAFATAGENEGGRAPGAPSAVDYSHLEKRRYQTTAEARIHAPNDSPEKVLFGSMSPREVFRRAASRQLASVYALDARDALSKLRSVSGKPLIDSPSYISPLTGETAEKQQAIKDLPKWRVQDATPRAVENTLGPGMTAEDLPSRRPPLASLSEIRSVQGGATKADRLAAQAGRDAERVGAANEVGQAGVENAAGKVGEIAAPTERVSAAMDPAIERRFGQMQAASSARLTKAGNDLAAAIDSFGAESPQVKPLFDAYSKAAETDAKFQTQMDAAKAKLGETMNRGLGSVDRSVAGQARDASKAVTRAGQQAAVRVDKATQTMLNRLERGTARFTDDVKSKIIARDLSLQKREVLDRFEKELKEQMSRQDVGPSKLFDPASVEGYSPLSKLAQGLATGEQSDLHAVNAIHKYLEAHGAPKQASSWIGRAIEAASRFARSSLVFNYVIHTGWNEGGITMAHMGPAGAEAVMEAMTHAPTSDAEFNEFFNTKKFSDAPGDTMKLWLLRAQKQAVGDRTDWHGSFGEHGEPGKPAGTDYATMRTAPLGSLPLKDRAAKIGYELQKANSDTVFNRGEHIYISYLMRHFVQNEGLSDAEAANKIQKSFSNDSLTDMEKNGWLNRNVFFFYPWMRTANELAVKLGVQKPQTWNAPLQGTRVQREGVGAEGVQMSKSNPFTIAKRDTEKGGWNYWGAPLWNKGAEPIMHAAMGMPGESPQDRVMPLANYLAGHLAPIPNLAVNAYEEATMGDKVAPWQRLWDPYGGTNAGDVARGVMSQFAYPLRAAQEIGAEPGKLGPALIGGSTGHSAGKTLDAVHQHEANVALKTLTEKRDEAVNKGQEPDPSWVADIQRLTDQGAHIEKRGEWVY